MFRSVDVCSDGVASSGKAVPAARHSKDRGVGLGFFRSAGVRVDQVRAVGKAVLLTDVESVDDANMDRASILSSLLETLCSR